jgi:transcription termination factor Rho
MPQNNNNGGNNYQKKNFKPRRSSQGGGNYHKNYNNNYQANKYKEPSEEELKKLKLPELKEKAASYNIELGTKYVKKGELITMIIDAHKRKYGLQEVSGILQMLPDGYGFLRGESYLPGEHDVYVPAQLIKQYDLRRGDRVIGKSKPNNKADKFARLMEVVTINGYDPEVSRLRPHFGELTPIYPDERLMLEHGKDYLDCRVIDLVSPIGKGQRGLIVSPPKAGKTTVLKDIAAAIHANNPEVHLICLLVDERPEEVTDMQRSVHGEVVSSTFDMPYENHISVAELVIERAKRMVEEGKDVVILLDSITRLARAYNLSMPASGRILSGGVDSTALYPPKKFLGAARNIENGGSLTILASALVETGSKMDEVIFEEFKGTGNMELRLDRELADKRIYPAIDPVASGTRKEEILLNPQEAPLIWAVRRILVNLNNTERSMEMLIRSLKQTGTNAEFLMRTAKRAQASGDHVEL